MEDYATKHRMSVVQMLLRKVAEKQSSVGVGSGRLFCLVCSILSTTSTIARDRIRYVAVDVFVCVQSSGPANN